MSTQLISQLIGSRCHSVAEPDSELMHTEFGQHWSKFYLNISLMIIPEAQVCHFTELPLLSILLLVKTWVKSSIT
jgi:hypothetical protein